MVEKGIQSKTTLDASAYPGLREIRGGNNAEGMTLALVVSRFNTELTGALAKSVIDQLMAYGADPKNISLTWVPGAYEVPAALSRILKSKSYDAAICLGCVIQGETPHADMINTYITRAVGELSREYDVPVLDGIVATHNMEQAVERCMPGEGCRGPYLAAAAVEMVDVFAKIKEE